MLQDSFPIPLLPQIPLVLPHPHYALDLGVGKHLIGLGAAVDAQTHWSGEKCASNLVPRDLSRKTILPLSHIIPPATPIFEDKQAEPGSVKIIYKQRK